MTALRGLVGALIVGVVAVAPVAVADGDDGPPEVGVACAADLADAMTLLPDGVTYVGCAASASGYAWAAVQTPFPPNDTWLSYGPPIVLHGQGMRNPNLSSGWWTAFPRDSQTRCRLTQTTVVEAGVLAAPEVTEGEPGTTLPVGLKPALFYAELAGNCLWVRQ